MKIQSTLFTLLFILLHLNGNAQFLWVQQFQNKQGAFVDQTYPITDVGNGGASSATMFQEKKNDQDSYGHFCYTLDKGNFRWDPYVSLNISIDNSKLPIGKIPEGIAYEYKGSEHSIVFQDSDISDYAYYQKKNKFSTEWKTITIPFSEFTQPSWGKKSDFNYRHLVALAFQVMGSTGEKGCLDIDNIRFVYEIPKTTTNALLTDSLAFQIKNVNPKNSPEITIADWKDFNTTALALTFDDGLISQTKYVRPILDKYQFKATFYLITDVLQSNPDAANRGKFGYWHQFLELYKNGHELGGHTCSHPRLTSLAMNGTGNTGSVQYEIQESLRILRQKMNREKIVTFAYPFVDLNEKIKSECGKFYISSRGLGNGLNHFYGGDLQDVQALTMSFEGYRTLAKDSAEVSKMISKIDEQLILNKKWSTVLFHDVFPYKELVNTADSWHPLSAEGFDYLCTELKARQLQNKIWISTVKDIVQYKLIRESIEIKNISNEQKSLMYTIHHPYRGQISAPYITIAWTSTNPAKSIKVENGTVLKKVNDNLFYINIDPEKPMFTISIVE